MLNGIRESGRLDLAGEAIVLSTFRLSAKLAREKGSSPITVIVALRRENHSRSVAYTIEAMLYT